MSLTRRAPTSLPAADGTTPRRGRPPARIEVLRNGRLGAHDPAALAARFGTPFYAYDLDAVGRRVAALRAVLPSSVDLAFAVKANPNLAILRRLGELGLGADVASSGELRHALRAGFDPQRLVFTGPGKTDEDLAAAVAALVGVVTVESVGELRRLEAIAARAGRRQPVLLRAAVSEQARLERVRLVGDDGAGKFGMDADDLAEAARLATASAWLEPLGLHAFGASNVLDAGALVSHADTTVRAAARLADDARFPLRLVDVGGGLGIPYEPHEDELDLATLGAGLDRIADELAGAVAARGTRLLLEPGRYLVGPAGAYVTRVVERKAVGGNQIVIVDGGIHHLVRPALVGQEQRVRVLTGGASRAAAGAQRFPVTVAGPLCSGLDVFAQAAVMALPEPGDLVAVLDAGAYGATESMPFFLSHPLPPEIVLDGETAWEARPRIEPEAWLGWQRAEPGDGQAKP